VHRSRCFAALAALATLCLTALTAAGAAGQPGGAPAPAAASGQSHKPVCGPVPPGEARCHAEVVTDANGTPLATSGPTGLAPVDLQSAYKLTSASAGGSSQTVAIVDAYDDPNAAADLATYRAQWGLTPLATGQFTKVNQTGTTSPLPAVNAGWAQEISLDLDAVTAVCPNCKILLVETNSSYMTDLGAGVDAAARLGAAAISNSYGGSEYTSETADESHFNHTGVAITVSSGDSGYGVQFPAASRYVTAVGGTSLTRSSSTRGWAESAWSGAGSGCSGVIPKPTWQTDAGCARRTVADVAAVADPNTGLAIYDSLPYQGASGWMQFGGTSLSSPIVAVVYALAGTTGLQYGSYPYSHRTSLFDVTSGVNGHCRRTAYLCTAGPGYDGPTGLGTPNGTAAF
jgi:subtilase family serine protease